MPKKKKITKKDLNFNKPAVKYAQAVAEGRSKTEAKTIAGYAKSTTTTHIERSVDFKKAEVAFRDVMLKKAPLEKIADQLADNIFQEGADKIDRHASNSAINIALKKIEPEEKHTSEEKVLVILSD